MNTTTENMTETCTNTNHTNTTNTETNGHTNNNSKGNKSYFTAVVSYFNNPGEGTDILEPKLITAKTRKELAQKLTDPNIDNVYGIFKGKQINFTHQRRIMF